MCLSASALDVRAQRRLSGSFLTQRLPVKYTCMMANRSGGSTVKEIISLIKEECNRCEENRTTSLVVRPTMNSRVEQHLPPQSLRPPSRECSVLAEWATDSYYRILIIANGGTELMLRTMKTFANVESIQEMCCLVLSSLFFPDGNSIPSETTIEIMKQVTVSMQAHSTSIATQSAGVLVLQNIYASAPPGSSLCPDDTRAALLSALDHTKAMRIQPSLKETITELIDAILTGATR